MTNITVSNSLKQLQTVSYAITSNLKQSQTRVAHLVRQYTLGMVLVRILPRVFHHSIIMESVPDQLESTATHCMQLDSVAIHCIPLDLKCYLLPILSQTNIIPH